MGGKHLFARDRLLGPADSSVLSKSPVSDLLDVGEEDIWSAGTLSSSNSGVWTLRRCGGSWDQSPAKEESAAAAAIRKRRGSWSAAETAKSAPVNVPGWARTEGSPEVEEDEEWVPPHEYVARVHGKTAVATSVFEGAGRTLKGRDMSRVRDAVWSRTGFFG